MKLFTGDLIFPEPNDFISWGVAKVTGSNFPHVGMVYDDLWIFEAHLGTNTRLNPISEYSKRKFRVLRPNLTEFEKNRIRFLMQHHNGELYSLWDIALNFVFSWLKPETRRSVVDTLGSRTMDICSELVGEILFNVNAEKFVVFKEYRGLQPVDVFILGLAAKMEEITDAIESPQELQVEGKTVSPLKPKE